MFSLFKILVFVRVVVFFEQNVDCNFLEDTSDSPLVHVELQSVVVYELFQLVLQVLCWCQHFMVLSSASHSFAFNLEAVSILASMIAMPVPQLFVSFRVM